MGATPTREDADATLNISIHAPAWGATTHYVGYSLEGIFQSTLPRGERHTPAAVNALLEIHFNPRSRVGSDTRKNIVLLDC